MFLPVFAVAVGHEASPSIRLLDKGLLEIDSRMTTPVELSSHALARPRRRALLIEYLASLNAARSVLWCYLIWYLIVLAKYFDSSARLWLSSLGISAIIGTALYLSTARSGAVRVVLGRWQIARLYMMPFCVSSFAALIKDRGFVLVFHPRWLDNVEAVGACASFCGLSWLARRATRPY